MSEDKIRYQRGLSKMTELFGPAAEKAVEGLGKTHPGLAKYLVEFPFGDIYSRPGLDSKTREMLTVAALTVIGYAQDELKEHIRGALHVGCSEKEILEIILQMAVYAGFPAALEATKSATMVFMEQEG